MSKILNQLRQNQNPLLRSALGTSGIKVISIFFSFFVNITITRLLGTYSYGIYAYSVSWILVLNIFALLGFRQLSLREISARRANKEWGQVAGVIKFSSVVIVASSISLIFLFCGISFVVLEKNFSDQLITIWTASLLIPIMSLSALRQAIIQGFDGVTKSQLPEDVIEPLSFLALILIFKFIFLDAANTSPQLIMLLKVISASMAFAAGGLILYKTVPEKVFSHPKIYEPKPWLSSALSLVFIQFMTTIYNKTDILMLGAMKGPESVGLYAVANKLTSFILFTMLVTSTVLGPQIAKLYSVGSFAKMQSLITSSFRPMITISAAITLTLVLGSQWILPIFGSGFIESEKTLYILSIGKFINVATGLVGLILTMTSHERDYAVVVGTGAILNVGLNVLLIPIFSQEGAATATAVTMAFCNLWLVLIVVRKVKLNPVPFNHFFKVKAS